MFLFSILSESLQFISVIAYKLLWCVQDMFQKGFCVAQWCTKGCEPSAPWTAPVDLYLWSAIATVLEIIPQSVHCIAIAYTISDYSCR